MALGRESGRDAGDPSRGHPTNSAPLIWINLVSGRLVSFPMALWTLKPLTREFEK